MRSILFAIVAALFCLPVTLAYATSVDAPAYTDEHRKLNAPDAGSAKDPASQDIYSGNPGSSMWREIRQGNLLTTQVKGDDAGVAIHAWGETWRHLKAKIPEISGPILGLAFLVPLLLFVIFGRFKISSGLSGESIFRFKLFDRFIHWSIALLFILLGLSGLVLMFGREYLIPLMGKQSFAAFASFNKEMHNILGPLFSIFLILVIIRFIRDNFYQKGDIDWLLKGGGILGEHVDAGRFNLGEKGWFWIVFFAGIIIVLSGFAMLFPVIFDGKRQITEFVYLFHSISAVAMISALCGHIYMSVAQQGALTGMVTGSVDKNWAKEHHSLWYEEQKGS